MPILFYSFGNHLLDDNLNIFEDLIRFLIFQVGLFSYSCCSICTVSFTLASFLRLFTIFMANETWLVKCYVKGTLTICLRELQNHAVWAEIVIERVFHYLLRWYLLLVKLECFSVQLRSSWLVQTVYSFNEIRFIYRPLKSVHSEQWKMGSFSKLDWSAMWDFECIMRQPNTSI